MSRFNFRRYDSFETQQFYGADEEFTKLIDALEGAGMLGGNITLDSTLLNRLLKLCKFYKECVEGLLVSMEEEIYENQ